MDLVKLILKNAKDIKKLERQLCCSSTECPDLSADVGNILECRDDGLFAEGGGGTLEGANNGLNLDGTNVQLGGPLIEPTSITAITATNTLTIANTSGDDVASFIVNGTLGAGQSDPVVAMEINDQSSAGIGLRVNGGTGINVFGLGIGIITLGGSIGIDATGDIAGNFNGGSQGISATSGSGPAITGYSTGSYAAVLRSDSSSLPSLDVYNRLSGVGSSIFTVGRFRTETASVVGIGSGLALEFQPCLPGAQVANALRVAIKWSSVASPTSQIDFFGFNANAATLMMTLMGNNGGRLGIGSTITTPTARLHLAAGSATASTAPLKFVSGTNLTTGETGAMEYNGTNLFFTRTGTTRESVFVGVDAAAAPTTAAFVSPVNFYGTSDDNLLATPNSWASVVIAGTTYKIPLYT